ncbi:MAG: hypothetical protein ABI156_07290, partial [Caldimonas sp.]
MNDTDINPACTALLEARHAGRCIDPLPAAWLAQGFYEACRLQQAMSAASGPIRGWKISGLTSDQQRAMGVAQPLCAPLLEPWVRDTGGSFALAQLIRPRLECE